MSSAHRPTSTTEELVSSSTHPDGNVTVCDKGLSLQLSVFAIEKKS
jgi:hypothetical protein